jgi:hypothetical protein
MPKLGVLSLLAVSACVGHQAAQAQVDAQMREQLLVNEVVIRDFQIYAMASGPFGGTFDGSRELLVTRAMRSMAHKLCGFVPTPGRRLEVGLQGVTLLSTETDSRRMAVVIRAPVQNPACKVIVLEPTQAPAEASRSSDSQPQTVDLGKPRSTDIVTRKMVGEY